MIWKGLPLVVIGSGGLSKEIYSIIRYINDRSNQQVFDFIGFIGASDNEVGNNVIDNYKIISSDREISDFSSKYPVIGMVISVGTPRLKKAIYEKVKNIPRAVFPNIIHPDIAFSKYNIELGKGNVITAGVNLTCDTKIGDFNLLSANSTIGHDTEIGDFNVINPLVAVSGEIKLKDCCLIGTGAQILQGLTINSYATIGAGAVVVKDVEANTTVVGVPARPIIKKEGIRQ